MRTIDRGNIDYHWRFNVVIRMCKELKDFVGWLEALPKKVCRWQPGVWNRYQLCRQGFHFTGGLLVGLAAYLLSLVIPVQLAYAILGSILAFVVIYKELSESQPKIKTLMDIMFWAIGYFIVMALDVVFTKGHV